jgi:hypothetical protein
MNFAVGDASEVSHVDADNSHALPPSCVCLLTSGAPRMAILRAIVVVAPVNTAAYANVNVCFAR